MNPPGIVAQGRQVNLRLFERQLRVLAADGLHPPLRGSRAALRRSIAAS